MKNKFTKLSAVFALLAFLAIPLGMRGQTTETVSLEDGVYDTDHITWTCADGNITIQQLKGTSGTAVNSNYISAPRVYKGHYLSFVASNDYTITSISITYNGSYMGNSMTAGTVVSENVVEDNPEDVDRTWGTVNNGTHVVSSVSEDGLEAIYIQNVATTTNVQLRPSEISVTYIAGTPAVTHTLTFGANPTEGGTVTVGSLTSPATVAEGATFNISATANSGYLFSNWTVVGAGSSIDETNGTFTMGTEDATLTANFTLVNTYTVTYYANVVGTTPIEEVYNEGEDVTVANNTFTNPGYAFTEWNTNESGTGDSYSPGDVIEDIDDDIELYAQWEESHETVDVLNWAATGSPTNYTDWTYTAPSGAAYAGQSSGNATGQYIQLRSNNNNSGIVTTTSIGNVTKVTVTWNSTTVNGRTLNVYGKNTAYSAATDLYGNDAGTLLGTIVCGTSTALNITGNYAYIGLRSANNAMYLDEIDITWAVSGTPAPYISAENVGIAYDATSGSIAYTINNGVDGGTLTASTNDTWLTLGTVGETVPFTCSVNEASAARTATVTLTYTYNRETVTKDVTVTQAGNPNVLNNISDITEVGSNYHVKGMVVATNSRGFVIGDGTGYVYTYMNTTPFSYGVGDNLSISGTTGQYGHIIQFTSSATIETVDETNYNGDPQPSVITEVPDYSQGNHLSDYFQFEGVLTSQVNNTTTNYYIALGGSSICISYPTTDQQAELGALLNKTVRVHGFFAGISSTTGFTVMMESVEEVVAPAEPSVTVTPDVIEAPAEGVDGTLAITYENIPELISFDMYFCDANGDALEEDPDWILAEIQEENNTYSVYYVIDANEGEARTAYFKVYTTDTPGNEEVYAIVTVNQAAYVAPPTPGEWVLTPLAELTPEDIFVITGTNADGTFAMTNNNGTQNAPAAVEVTVAGQTLSGEIADTLKWNMTYNSGNGYTFYPNGQTATWLYCYTNSSNNRLRVGTNANKAFNLDAESGYITFDTHVNDIYYIGIYNSQDWRGYTSNGGNIANQTFAFYKKVVDPTAPKITVSPSTLDVSATEVDINTLSITVDNLEVASATDFTVQFYDASGEEQEMPEWILAQAAGNINYDGYTVACVTIPNPGAARTAYFRVYANDANNNVVYSNLVTVSQASDPTYAVLPFQYDDDGSAITETDGLYSIGINNLDESPKLDFFRTGSWLLLQFQEAPGTLTFDIKGVDFAGGTFKVMTSADGETYTDIATYTDTELGDEIQTMEFDNLSENVRFIKWVYTEQVDGDVALGNIVLAKPYIPPFTGDTYTLATSVEPGRHYIIVGFNGDNAYAMGGQNSNNRAAVSITVEDGVAQVSSNEVHEFVINTVGFTDEVDPYSGQQSVGSGMAVYPGYWQYTIYDPADLGYLYAASSSSNYLRTEIHLDANDNGVWSIEIYDNVAHIVAFGNNDRKVMRFNSSGNGLFSCYGTVNNMKDIYLYVKDEDVPQYDFYKDITGYGTSNGGYCLVATPTTENANPNMVGMITDDGTNPENFSYDLYSFDFTQELEWLNYRAGAFNLLNGQGYLYANQSNVTLHFQGASYASKTVSLSFENTNYDWNGWNLIGNPLSDVAWVGTSNFYVMNTDGTEVELAERSYVNPMEGIFVKASAANQSIYFTNDFWYYEEPGGGFDFRVSGENGSDVARVCFGEGQGLEKFQLNPNHTKVYFQQGSKDYAVVRSANEGEMPVSFKAEENGTYTFSVNTESVEMNYLHLIDNMTGADVDLLVEPSYRFEAKTTDYASRFKLVFSTNSTNENGNETFAFFSGSEWSISNIGEATLQVVDVMGRIIISETVNGNVTLTTDNLSAGVYVMRLVNGNNVKTQKVIVR